MCILGTKCIPLYVRCWHGKDPSDSLKRKQVLHEYYWLIRHHSSENLAYRNMPNKGAGRDSKVEYNMDQTCISFGDECKISDNEANRRQ